MNRERMTATAAPPIFERMSALADTTRSRLLLLLERHELTVGELCAVLQLPQSTVSRHLKLLGDEAWVAGRAEGTSRRYRMAADRLEPSARRLWSLVRGRSRSRTSRSPSSAARRSARRAGDARA
jgi:DNA-binding transcriptional ArsR family regulator